MQFGGWVFLCLHGICKPQPNEKTKMGKYILSTIVALGLLVNASAQDWNINNGLVVYYPLNGDLIDYSGNSNNGINNGSTFTTDRFGNPDGALAVSTDTGFISQKDIVINGNTPKSISLWVNPSSDPTWPNGNIIQWGAGYGPNSGVGGFMTIYYKPFTNYQNLNNGDNLVWDGYYSGLGVETTPNSLAGNWWNIVLTYDGATPQFYLNGVLQTNNYSSSNLNLINTYQSPLVICGGGRGINGALSDIRIYNYALTSNNVSQLYATESVPEPSTYALIGIGAIGMLMVMRRKMTV
jgi:hypothetical protein